MSTTSTTPPQYETDERVTYTAKRLKPLTDAQQRLILVYALHAQGCERMELRWVDGHMVVQLVNTQDKKRL